MMMDNLFTFPKILDNEDLFYKKFQPGFIKILNENYAPINELSFQKASGYSTVYFKKDLLCRFQIRNKSNYLSVSEKWKTYFPLITYYQIKSDINFIRINLDKQQDTLLSSLKKSLQTILETLIYSQPKEYDLCDLYKRCSDAKMCVHPKREFSLHCGYKRIMKSGRIFYGNNRNID